MCVSATSWKEARIIDKSLIKILQKCHDLESASSCQIARWPGPTLHWGTLLSCNIPPLALLAAPFLAIGQSGWWRYWEASIHCIWHPRDTDTTYFARYLFSDNHMSEAIHRSKRRVVEPALMRYKIEKGLRAERERFIPRHNDVKICSQNHCAPQLVRLEEQHGVLLPGAPFCKV